MKRTEKVNGNTNGKKIFLLTLGAGVVAGAGFLAYEHFKKSGESNTESNSSVVPVSSASGANDNFPLKFGSKGQRVVQLQQKLEKILGADKLNELTPIDGIWGNGTEKALKLAGLPTLISQSAFDKIMSSNTGIFSALQSGIQSGIQKLSSSMSGLGEIRDIVTIVPTFVIDKAGHKIPVKKNVILGQEILVSNGMTRFKGIDGTVCSAPARDVRYV
jgi:hypothetical protein